MKIVQVVPISKIGSKMKALLKDKEKELRGSSTTFYRSRKGKWKHVKYSGWINWDKTKGGLLVAKVQTKKEEDEWKLLQAFIGYLDRNLGKNIESISIYFR